MTKQELLKNIDSNYKNNNHYRNPLLTETAICSLHRLCCKEKHAGTYRLTDASPLGKGHMPPAPNEINHFMHHFINQMETSHIMFHPIEFAVIAYKRLLDIFPFESHNEETALLFMNLLLAQEGYPIVDSPVHMEGYEATMEKARIMPFPDTDSLVMLIGKMLLA